MDSPDSYEANSKGWTTTLSRSKFDKVLGSLEGKFKNFVSGDEEPEGGRRSFEGADTKGPFARIASDTGTITKVASMSSLRESYTLPSSTYGNDSYPIPHQNLTRAVSYGGHQPVPHSYHPPNPYEPMQPTINDPPSLSMTRQNESYQYETPPTCAGGHLLNVNTPAGTSAEDDNSQFLTPMHGPPLPSSSSHQNATVDSKETDFVDDEEDDLGLGTTRKKKVEVRDKEEKEIKSKKPVQVKKEADESGTPTAWKHDLTLQDKPAAGGWLGRIFGKGIAKQDQGGKVHRVKLGDEMKLVYDEKLKRWVNPNVLAQFCGDSNMQNKEAYMAESALPPPPPRSRSATPGGESTSSSIVPPLKTEQTASSTLPGLGGSAVMSAPGSRSTSTVPSVSRTNSAPLRHQESIDDLLGIPAMTRKGGNAGRKGAKRYVDVFQNQS
ncbi:COPII coat assembly protein sec16 [Neolecta irregularis DAH-3]|uniref:COPII coat assembly protein sec16 n=1 Tax=Neolecta irregularis (strain DAH-3) TaxID=1198029 RepID=A0A1U7LQL5_NEOID|nr:COPII coat assembly protein sec16 [Neolecta irregularis DAH-3]|eukprot:OLL24934.1 COPII coat assembly protein sec16 [Neolecta irregularis DAH-3]